MLGTPAVIVSEGGVGRPIDEIVLNAELFRANGVEVAGAIVNKVDVDAQPGIATVLERGLAPYGIPLLGVLPVRPILSNPTLGMILEGVHGETIHPGPDLDRVIDGVAIGAMEAGHMLERVGPGTLVIVPGDREDVILTLTTAHFALRLRRASAAESARIASIAAAATNEGVASIAGHEGAAVGLVLTGGYRPRQSVLDAIREADIFATLVKEDTYVVASEVHDLLVKTHAADREKIAMIKRLVAEHLDIEPDARRRRRGAGHGLTAEVRRSAGTGGARPRAPGQFRRQQARRARPQQASGEHPESGARSLLRRREPGRRSSRTARRRHRTGCPRPSTSRPRPVRYAAQPEFGTVDSAGRHLDLGDVRALAVPARWRSPP